MAIGLHEPSIAHDTDLRKAIAVGLDEAFTALEESFHDLSDEQLQSFPVPGRNNIAWLVMHCLDNLDEHANGCASGRRTFPSEWRWNLWNCCPDERPRPGDPFPPKEEMLATFRAVREAAMAIIEQLEEPALIDSWIPHPLKHSCADFYMRTIYHTMAHVRQISLLRGALGLTDGQSWPRQHWA
jgi:hypothetical protein